MTKAQRVFWFFMASLFLVTSLGFSGLVIWQIHQDGAKKKQNDELQKDISDAQIKQNAQNAINQDSTKNNTNTGGKLKGTKLVGFTPSSSPVTELQKIDQTVGTGAEVKAGDKVTVHYTGALVKDGTIFESSKDSGQTATFGLDQVIKGWTDGLPGMKVGGKRRLIIPAVQAYGSQDKGDIPANSDLVFDIELVSISQ